MQNTECIRFDKLVCIRFDKVNAFIIIYDGTRYLVLLSPEKYGAIYNRIRYLIKQESDIFSRNYAKIKIYSYDSLPLKNTLILHNVIITSVLNKSQSH